MNQNAQLRAVAELDKAESRLQMALNQPGFRDFVRTKSAVHFEWMKDHAEALFALEAENSAKITDAIRAGGKRAVHDLLNNPEIEQFLATQVGTSEAGSTAAAHPLRDDSESEELFARLVDAQQAGGMQAVHALFDNPEVTNTLARFSKAKKARVEQVAEASSCESESERFIATLAATHEEGCLKGSDVLDRGDEYIEKMKALESDPRWDIKLPHGDEDVSLPIRCFASAIFWDSRRKNGGECLGNIDHQDAASKKVMEQIDRLVDEATISDRWPRMDSVVNSVVKDFEKTIVHEAPDADAMDSAKGSTSNLNGRKLRRTNRIALTVRSNESKELFLIRALSDHHEYDRSLGLNHEPIRFKELCKRASCSPATASKFFKVHWGSFKQYVYACRSKRVIYQLLQLNGDEQRHAQLHPETEESQ
ncbi:hypothetical protein K227x_26230 [Rubripirellula lacrimiformis]|uniref:Uncharacterized protein n=1 Tax=Rubripirellula lacrimiformis TaxID=1930273 RepID=A0A517NAS4_9BACT|nr:hypothetical protein [Rubripirellula lacrimiformis]QDT04233.1 hypothetical protein K227x_26230 [Rubripirellula lacrimiformis]